MRWNFSFKWLHVDIKYGPTLDVRACVCPHPALGPEASVHPCPLPLLLYQLASCLISPVPPSVQCRKGCSLSFGFFLISLGHFWEHVWKADFFFFFFVSGGGGQEAGEICIQINREPCRRRGSRGFMLVWVSESRYILSWYLCQPNWELIRKCWLAHMPYLSFLPQTPCTFKERIN